MFGSGIKHLKILHRPGRENVAADALSYNPAADVSSTMDIDAVVSSVDSIQQTNFVNCLVSQPSTSAVEGNFHVEQRKDPKLKELIDYLEEAKLPSNEHDARKIAT